MRGAAHGAGLEEIVLPNAQPVDRREGLGQDVRIIIDVAKHNRLIEQLHAGGAEVSEQVIGLGREFSVVVHVDDQAGGLAGLADPLQQPEEAPLGQAAGEIDDGLGAEPDRGDVFDREERLDDRFELLGGECERVPPR